MTSSPEPRLTTYACWAGPLDPSRMVARGVELDLGAAGHAGQRLVIEGVEGRVGAQKVGDVLH